MKEIGEMHGPRPDLSEIRLRGEILHEQVQLHPYTATKVTDRKHVQYKSMRHVWKGGKRLGPCDAAGVVGCDVPVSYAS